MVEEEVYPRRLQRLRWLLLASKMRMCRRRLVGFVEATAPTLLPPSTDVIGDQPQGTGDATNIHNLFETFAMSAVLVEAKEWGCVRFSVVCACQTPKTNTKV